MNKSEITYCFTTKYMSIQRFITYIIIVFLIISCKHSSNKETVTISENAKVPFIELTSVQIEQAHIKTQKIEKKLLPAVVECSGKVEVPTQNIITVTAPMGGIIRECLQVPGTMVKKGTLLAVLENPEYTIVQQDFLQSAASIDYYKEEFRRQGELTLENAASLKKMQSSQADFKSIEAKYNALKKQLMFIGIDPEKLTADNITTLISVYAPVSGYLNHIEGNTGKYIEPFHALCEIVDRSELQLILKISENDILNIKPGQIAKFSIASNPKVNYNAKIEMVGKSINEPDRSILVYAKITGKSDGLIPGMFVNATVYLTDKLVFCVPDSAIVKPGNETILFVSDNNKFIRKHVKCGAEKNGYVEIIDSDTSLLSDDIVTSGAYFLNLEWNKVNNK